MNGPPLMSGKKFPRTVLEIPLPPPPIELPLPSMIPLPPAQTTHEAPKKSIPPPSQLSNEAFSLPIPENIMPKRVPSAILSSRISKPSASDGHMLSIENIPPPPSIHPILHTNNYSSAAPFSLEAIPPPPPESFLGTTVSTQSSVQLPTPEKVINMQTVTTDSPSKLSKAPLLGATPKGFATDNQFEELDNQKFHKSVLPLPELLAAIPTPNSLPPRGPTSVGQFSLDYLSSVPPPDFHCTPPPSMTTSFPAPVDFRTVPPPDWEAQAQRYATTKEPNALVTNLSNYRNELDTWFADILEYEKKMNSYFEQCSSKLHDWHKSGGSQTEEYEREYTKLMEEYQRHANYMNQMREYYGEQTTAITGADSSVPPPPKEAPPLPAESFATTNSIPSPATVSAEISSPNAALIGDKAVATTYRQYYLDMIDYFKNLLEAQGETGVGIKKLKESQERMNLKLHEKTSAKSKTVKTKKLKEKPKKNKKANKSTSNFAPEDIPMPEEKETKQEISSDEFPYKDGAQIMNDFRAAFGGKFDWAHWHSYMSTISRTHPEWYEMFKEQSRSLSIDWDKMYTDWAVSQGVTPNLPTSQSTEKDTPDTVPSMKTTAQTVSKNEAPPPPQAGPVEESEDEGDDWSFCAACDQHFTNEPAYMRHLRGLGHTQRVIDKQKVKKPEEFAEEVKKQEEVQAQEPSAHEKHMEWLMEQCKMQRMKGLGLSGSFYCTLCNVEVTSQKALDFHLNGRKHLNNLEIVKLTGALPPPEAKQAKKKPTVRIQNILDQCVEPLIGLNYVTEYQREDPSSQCRYFCELCDNRFEAKNILPHLVGAKHRRTYIKFNYPDLHEILDQDGSALAKIKRLEVFAKKIEDHEGRKKMSIKVEIANPVLKEKKRSEAVKKKKELMAKERRAAEELTKQRTREREERRRKRAHQRERARREKAIVWLQHERNRRLAKSGADYDIQDLEDGEIASDIDEEYQPDESSIRQAIRRLPPDSSDSESSEEFLKLSTKHYLSDDEENNLGGVLGAGDEREDDYDELEMAEFEDIYKANRPPLTLHLPMDSERDDFIRRIKEKRLFQLKELDDKSVEHFLLEAEWGIQRTKKQSELRESIMKTKQKHEEMLKQSGSFGGMYMNSGTQSNLVLPPLAAPMGPLNAPPPSTPVPGIMYPPPMTDPIFGGNVQPIEADSMQRMMQSIYSMTGLPNMRPPSDGRKRGPILPTPQELDPKRFRGGQTIATPLPQSMVNLRPGLLLPPPTQPLFTRPPPPLDVHDNKVDFYSAMQRSNQLKTAALSSQRTLSDIKSDVAAEQRTVLPSPAKLAQAASSVGSTTKTF